MRLISTDKLKAIIGQWCHFKHRETFIFPNSISIPELFELLETAPTVKAIPIEWILKWACEFIDPNSDGYKMAMELVHDWRKENEHKESD